MSATDIHRPLKIKSNRTIQRKKEIRVTRRRRRRRREKREERREKRRRKKK